MRPFLLFIAVALLAAFGLVGCADDQGPQANRTSTIPWNRPEPWESQGPMGGMMPNSR